MSSKFKFRVGQWLPEDIAVIATYIEDLTIEVYENDTDYIPPVAALKNLIESSPYYTNLFTAMFTEIPNNPKYWRTPTNLPQVRDYTHMLKLINAIMSKPPEFNTTGLVGFPINAILDYPMGTRAGYEAFKDSRVNKKFKAILDYWKHFLESEASAAVLNQSSKGWLCHEALKELCYAAVPELKEKKQVNFEKEFPKIYNCPSPNIEDRYGFTSWDAFFTRTFNKKLRPVPPNEDHTYVISNACESAPYRLAFNVPAENNFWIKGQPYSLKEMLGFDELASKFYNGTVYQAFLSALSYHRWHSPVDGTIVKAYVIDGSYYSEDYGYGFTNPDGPDLSAPNDSQAYLTEMATRALIFIEADNTNIGLMCFMAVGMAEVSSNEITVKAGQHVVKGEQLGMFHFGGSTHCLLFRPGVPINFYLHNQTPGLDSDNIPVHTKIATVPL